MEYWEFLLEKEGDSSYLNLEIPTSEIEEGKYQLFAYSSKANTDVEIIITYVGEDQSQTFSDHYCGYTNSEGMMVIIPSIYFEPGTWEITCYPDLLSELFDNFWQFKITLTVLPIEHLPLISPEIVIDNEMPIETEFSFLDSGQKKEIIDSKINLILDKTTFVNHHQDSLIISGRIDSENPDHHTFKGMLRYELRDPKSGEVLLSFQQNLREQGLPLLFSYTIVFPQDWDTCLVLGEVILEVFSQSLQKLQILQRVPFTIVAELNQLLNRVQDIESLWKDKKEEVLFKLDLLDLQNIEKDFSKDLKPSLGLILPPQIADTKKVIKPLELPQCHKNQAKDKVFDPIFSSVDQDFRALKVQERFSTRLSALAKEDGTNS